MPASLEDSLQVVAPYFSDALVSTQVASDLRAIARIFPDSDCSLFGFECRLSEEAAEVDFGVMIPKEEDREIQARPCRMLNLSPEALNHPVWRRVKAFESLWEDPSSALHSEVEQIYLLFDLNKFRGGIPLPGLLLGNKTKRWFNHANWSAVKYGLGILEGAPLAQVKEINLGMCLDQLPHEAHVFATGVMMPRREKTVKLYVGGLNPEGMLQYLSRIGWAGSRESVSAFLLDASHFIGQFALALEVGTGIKKRIGIECYNPTVRQFTEYLAGYRLRNALDYLRPYAPKRLHKYLGSSMWRPFLNHLIERGLCTHAKRDGLLAWSGSSRQRPDDGAEQICMSRVLNHVKVTCSSEGNLTAKAYLRVAKWLLH